VTAAFPRRSGFTLIELLIVISMLAVLSAIAVGTYFRVRTAAVESATERVLQRFQLSLDAQVKAILDQAKDEASGKVAAPAGLGVVRFVAANGTAGTPDPDRLIALWAMCRLRNELPVTFQEAVTPVQFTFPPNTSGNGPYGLYAGTTVTVLPAKPLFTGRLSPPAYPTGTPFPIPNPEEPEAQSAALLYMLLSERGSRGALTGDDVAAGSPTPFNFSVTVGGVTSSPQFTVFRDPFGTPVGYLRWAVNPNELNKPPFSNNLNLPSQNPLDPRGTLRNTTPQGSAWAGNFADVVRGGLGMPLSGTTPPTWIADNNWVATVVSAGPNRKWDWDGKTPTAPLLLNTQPTPIEESNPKGFGTTDNIYGFRLRAKQ
jgi:prepilin-type N-terminal cleavage/methylation domain-containing protein